MIKKINLSLIDILDAKADTWDNQQANQCYKLEGTNPAEYIVKDTCPDASLFEVVSHENVGTANWRVTVKNKETNTTTSGVYPFNLNGSLYQLESGEWVIASCGGTAIESSWSGQQSNEVYKLTGTGEMISLSCPQDQYFDNDWNDPEFVDTL